MKKVILVLVAAIFFIGVLVSCNKSVCPAYVKDTTVKVENNG